MYFSKVYIPEAKYNDLAIAYMNWIHILDIRTFNYYHLAELKYIYLFMISWYFWSFIIFLFGSFWRGYKWRLWWIQMCLVQATLTSENISLGYCLTKKKKKISPLVIIISLIISFKFTGEKNTTPQVKFSFHLRIKSVMLYHSLST